MTEVAEARAVRAADRIAAEGSLLRPLLTRTARSVCLDAGGDVLDSASFARILGDGADSGVGEITFVIGGPDGLDLEVLAGAAVRISFGRVTWPHQIVRVLLAEQLYRAMTILSGHPYHRA